MSYNEIEGDLVELAKSGEFNVIVHGCNCYCMMGSGIAYTIAKTFPDAKNVDKQTDIIEPKDKLGKCSTANAPVTKGGFVSNLVIVNAYTQLYPGSGSLSYDAIASCLDTVNEKYAGQKVGLPLIGCGIAGGDWTIVKNLIIKHLRDCHVTVVHYKPTNK